MHFKRSDGPIAPLVHSLYFLRFYCDFKPGIRRTFSGIVPETAKFGGELGCCRPGSNSYLSGLRLFIFGKLLSKQVCSGHDVSVNRKRNNSKMQVGARQELAHGEKKDGHRLVCDSGEILDCADDG